MGCKLFQVHNIRSICITTKLYILKSMHISSTLYLQLFFNHSFYGFNYSCGGHSINRPIKVRIVGPVAHPRRHIRPRRPSQVIGQLPRGVVVNITRIEFCIRPRTPYSSAVCVRGRSGRGFVATGPQNYVTTEDRITDQG